MKFLIITWMMIVPGFSTMADVLQELRSGYPAAVYSEKICNQMADIALQYKASNPIIQAYYAALQGVKAKHVWNPYQKLNYVKDFEREITAAVEKAPKNLEVRYLRYSIEANIPSMLGLQKHIEEDLKVVYDQFISSPMATSDKDFYQGVFDFLKSQNVYSEAQLRAMQAKLNQVK